MSTTQLGTTSTAPSKALDVALWIGQLALAWMFGMAGLMKLTSADRFPYPTALTLFIGTAEVLGVVGVIVPALTRIKPVLTPLAAAGFATIMVLAIGVHLSAGEPVVMNLVLLAVAVFVAWGRFRLAPIAGR